MKVLYLIAIIFLATSAFGQNFKILDGSDELKQNNHNIRVALLLMDDTLGIKVGQNDFSKIDYENCKAIQVIIDKDTLLFNEKIAYSENTNPVIANILNQDQPNFKLILTKDWTLIVDKVPVRNKKLKKVIQKDVSKGTNVIALETDKLYWIIMDKNYKP